MIRVPSALLLPLLVVVLAVAPRPTPAAERDTLTVGLAQFPATFHPSIDSMAAKSWILGAVRRNLTAHDTAWEVTCQLCTDLPDLEAGSAEIVPVPEDVGDGSGRGIRVTYTIDPDARWGDGTPVTTDDFLFTWELGRHPASPFVNAELYRRMLEVVKVDDRTFTVLQDRVSFNYPALNDFRPLPAHLERPVFEADPEGYRVDTLYESDPTNPGLWNGPYRLAAVTKGSSVVLERNTAWAGKRPAFDRIVVRVVENTAALEAALLSGDVDYVAGELGFPIDQALALEKRVGDRFRVFYHPGLYYEHLEARLDDPRFADPRVRRALLMAIDRETIVERLFGGKPTVARTSVSPLDWVYADDTPYHPFDPQAAMVLLDEAGWAAGPNGIRTRDGTRLQVTLATTSGNRMRERVQQLVQAQWRAIGVEAVIRNQPPRILFGEMLRKRTLDGVALFAWISAPENVPRSTLHSEEIPTAAGNWSGQNYPGYANPRMDELIDTITVTLDREKRAALWRELQHLYAEDLPALPLWFRVDSFFVPKWLAGIEPTGHMTYSTNRIEDWRVVDPPPGE